MLEILNMQICVQDNILGHKQMLKQAYTVNETINEIGIGRSKLYAEIKEGKITPRKIGKKTIFLAKDIEDYLNALPKANA